MYLKWTFFFFPRARRIAGKSEGHVTQESFPNITVSILIKAHLMKEAEKLKWKL